MCARLTLALSLVAASIVAAPASVSASAAEGREVRLRWTSVPGCPGRAELAEDLERLSGGSMRASTQAESTVDAVISAEASGYALSLRVVHEGRTETRTLRADDCRTLGHAAVLITAVTLAPVAAADGLSAPRPVSPSREPEAAPSLVPRVPSTAQGSSERSNPVATDGRVDGAQTSSTASNAPPSRSTPRVLLGAFVGPALSMVPGPALTAGGDAGVAWGALSVHVMGAHVLATERVLEPGVGVRASITAGGLHVRYSPTVGPLQVPLRAGVEVGGLRGGGVGERVAGQTGVSVWAAGVVGAGLAWPARSRVGLELSAEAVLGLVRPGIVLVREGRPQPAYQTPSVGARILLGPRLRLP